MMIAEVVDGTRLVSTLNGDSDVVCFLCNHTVSMRGQPFACGKGLRSR